MSGPRRIAVTGASRGLGRALARGFAAAGHVVLGCARSEEALASLAAELSGGPDFGHDFRRVDVARDDEVRGWARHVLALGPPPDLVVSNAGVIHRNAALWELDDAEVARVLDVNVRGVANIARHFLPPMIAAGRGVLANLSSGWGRSTSPEVSVYCASKWAVEGLTQALAQELPPGLAAVAVNPGVIDTDMLRSCWSDAAGSYPGPDAWARTAVPFFLALGTRDNGAARTVA